MKRKLFEKAGNILFIHDNKDKRKVAASAKLLQILDLV